MRIHLSKRERREREELREKQLIDNINVLRVDVELLDMSFDDESDIFAMLNMRDSRNHYTE